MLDPNLFDLYSTGDDRIDEDWVIQSNPPCAFRANFKDGCDALLALLQEDPNLHASKGWLNFTPLGEIPLDEGREASVYEMMGAVVRTAERELKG